jgi:hypothetical protein
MEVTLLYVFILWYGYGAWDFYIYQARKAGWRIIRQKNANEQ